MAVQDTVALKRSDIISLLSEACELEHGLACSYLYAAFSLKQSTYENDLTWEQLQFTRKWAGQLYFIASQEMFHLSQAWNLLTAIGGSPYYMRPNFPQGHRYYPIDLPLLLEPFGRHSLKRFIFYELPAHVSDIEFLEKEFGIPAERINKAFTVGKLYNTILAGIEAIPEQELFIGDPALQVGPETCHFNEIVKVTDHASAAKAVMAITEQGEGTSNDQQDCHFGLFVSMEKELHELSTAATASGRIFLPSRDTVRNPAPVFYFGQTPHGSTIITNPFTADVAALFDKIYSLMLRVLQYVFAAGPLPRDTGRLLSGMAIQMMVRVLKPVGEALTVLPAFDHGDKTAGAAFGLYRHVSFPADLQVTITLIRENLQQIIDTGKTLCENENAPDALIKGIEKLAGIKIAFENGQL